MPLFFFNVYDGNNDVDEEGVHLANADTALREAIKYAGAVLGEADLHDFADGWRLEVLGEDRRLILNLSFAVNVAAEDGVSGDAAYPQSAMAM